METLEKTLADGIAHHQRGEVEQAVNIYRAILEEEPENAEALHLMGVSALQIGQYGQAVELIEKAIRFKDDSATYYNNLGAAYHNLLNLEKSEQCYLKAIELKPAFADAYGNLGNLYQEKNELVKAKQQYYRCLSINPEHKGAFESLQKMQGGLAAPGTSGDQSQSNEFTGSRVLNPNLFEPGKKHVLHVGCGDYSPLSLNERYRNEEWKEIRLDININCKPDILASLTDMSAVETNSVDAVFSSHNIEHLYAHDVPIALREFLRVLKPGGHALITLPDMQQIAEYIVEDRLHEVIYEAPIGPITGVDFIFGHGGSIAKGNHYMAHLTGFTATSLKLCLEEAGFVRINPWFSPFNLWVEAFKA